MSQRHDTRLFDPDAPSWQKPSTTSRLPLVKLGARFTHKQKAYVITGIGKRVVMAAPVAADGAIGAAIGFTSDVASAAIAREAMP